MTNKLMDRIKSFKIFNIESSQVFELKSIKSSGKWMQASGLPRITIKVTPWKPRLGKWTLMCHKKGHLTSILG